MVSRTSSATTSARELADVLALEIVAVTSCDVEDSRVVSPRQPFLAGFEKLFAPPVVEIRV